MNYAAAFVLSVVVVILIVDKIFMPKHAKRAWQMMAFAYSFAIIFALFPGILTSIAEVLGIGRGVDVIIYCLSFILIREIFISRSRQNSSERQMTILTRQFAIFNAQLINPKSQS
jgi:hypothetical protein